MFHLPFLFLLPTSFIYIKSLFITIIINLCFCWYCWWRWFFLVFSWSCWIFITLIRSHHPCHRHWSKITVLRTTATVLKTLETLSIKMVFKRVIVWKRMIRGLANLVYLYSSDVLISTSMENLCFFHLQISL